jgi:hypothetical protein
LCTWQLQPSLPLWLCSSSNACCYETVALSLLLFCCEVSFYYALWPLLKLLGKGFHWLNFWVRVWAFVTTVGILFFSLWPFFSWWQERFFTYW